MTTLWRIGLVALFLIAAPGFVFAERLRRTSKLLQRALRQAPDDELLVFVVSLHSRTAIVRLMLSGYLVLIVPAFMLLSVDDGVIIFPLWLGLVAVIMNMVWAAFVAHACWRDHHAWMRIWSHKQRVG